MASALTPRALSSRDLNRTLLARQGLLDRRPGTTEAVIETVRHLLGLQAQASLPPYLSLAARLDPFDPREPSAALGANRLLRLVSLRGTVHLLVPEDALALRAFTAPVQERERRSSQTLAEVRDLDPDAVRDAVDAALADGPLPIRELGRRLAGAWPDRSPTALGGLARVVSPLAQVPPRGQWKASGGVVYQRVDALLGQPLRPPDVPDLVRRYLRAFGPATAADVSAWSGVTGLGPVVKQLEAAGDLVRRTGPDGKPLLDVPDGVVVDGDTPAPVRLLGLYDNLWLSHKDKDRVATPAKRKAWMGPNGGRAGTIFVDGMLEGLWRVEDDRPAAIELFRTLTRHERTELDEELDRVATLLATPADAPQVEPAAGPVQ